MTENTKVVLLGPLNKGLDTLRWLFRPNQPASARSIGRILAFQILFFLVWWATRGPFAIFPSLGEVIQAWIRLWNSGLMVHVWASLTLNLKAITLAVIFSLGLVYLTVMPVFRPVALVVSKLRFLSMVGISFLVAVNTDGTHSMKVTFLVLFISFFFVTGMMSVVANIPDRAYHHARALGMSEWRVVLEVVVRGQLHHATDLLFQNLAIGWMMLASVEGLAMSDPGIGGMLLREQRHLSLGEVFAIQGTVFVLALIIDYLGLAFRKWKHPYAFINLERQ